jgi:SAM-dependent methyltransferase
MRRIHAPELEDEPWFPSTLRDGLTEFLRVASERLRLFESAAPLLKQIVHRHRATRLVDLCSGGGGALLSIVEELEGVEVVLTDLYPNERAFDVAERRLPHRVRGYRAPIDATNVPDELDGVRTIFNALHHFRPPDARRIFADAARKRQPICAFEIVERRPATLAAVAGSPLAVLALTPFSRPDLRKLFFTYGLPLIPLGAGWDGMASCLRAYGLEELRALVEGIDAPGYRFVVDRVAGAGFMPFRVTYVVGEPA